MTMRDPGVYCARVRTTVNLDEQLLRQARQEALRSGRPLGAVIDDALKVLLNRSVAPDGPMKLPTDGGSGLRPGVDLEDQESLADLLGQVGSSAVEADR